MLPGHVAQMLGQLAQHAAGTADSGERLGEVGVPHDDEGYEGSDPNPAPALSMEYFRAQYLRFQQTLNAVDRAYRAGLIAYGLSPDAELGALLEEYRSNVSTWRGLAETLNMGSSLVNALGGRLPALSLPGTLAALPALALPAAVVVAVGSVSAWVAWSQGFVSGVESGIERIRSAPDVSDEAKARLLGELRDVQQSAQVLGFSGLGGIATAGGAILKWGAIALAAFLGWRLLERLEASDD